MPTPFAEDNIVQTTLSQADIVAGVQYGIKSRAWTYDRMGAQARGHYGRAIFRIAVGRAVQHAVQHYLENQGITLREDETHYTETDHWDVRSSQGISVDIKGAHYFTNFNVEGRPPLTTIAIANSSNAAEWSTFFPMLVPCDQFDKNPKNAYLFYLLAARSSSRVPYVESDAKLLIALPHSTNTELNQIYARVHTSKPANQRVALGETFSMSLTMLPDAALRSASLRIGYGDPYGEATQQALYLLPGASHVLQNMTALHYVRLRFDPVLLEHRLMNQPLFEVTFQEVLPDREIKWTIHARDFEDVWIYDDNQLYLIGWLTDTEFDRIRQQHPHCGPHPKENRNTRLSHTDNGIAKAGTYCYFYPPSFGGAYPGGTKNNNYYCLPQNLRSINELVAWLQ